MTKRGEIAIALFPFFYPCCAPQPLEETALSPSLISLILLSQSLMTGMGLVSGVVEDPNGVPLPDAQVFLEPGLTGLMEAQVTDASGVFRFENLTPGAVGLIAFHPDYAFAGTHLNISIEGKIEGLKLRLAKPASLELVVKNYEGHPVAGARLTRIALLGEHKVGIPLAKLAAFGFPLCDADKAGRIEAGHLPAGAIVAP